MVNRRDLIKLGLASFGATTGRLNRSCLASTEATARPIIDTNVSLFQWPFRRLPLDRTDRLTKRLAMLGIVQAWAGSFEGILQRDTSGVNARLVTACGDRSFLVPIGSINPTLPDWAGDLRRCVEEYAMPGIRLYPNYHGYRLDDARFAELLELATAQGCFVQLAVSLEDERTQSAALRVPDVDLAPLPKLLTRFGDVRVQLLNCRPNQKLLEAVEPHPNLYLDTARVEGTDGVPQLVSRIAAGRVLLGSHAPFLIPEAALIRTHESSGLRPRALEGVLIDNAKQFFSSQPSPGSAAEIVPQQVPDSSPRPTRADVDTVSTVFGLPTPDELRRYRIWDSYFTPAFAHPGPDGFSQLEADIERSLPAIEKGQFEKLCLFPHVGIGTTSDHRFETLVQARPNLVLEPFEKWPNLLLGMIQLNANQVAASLDALNRWLRDGPMLGVYFPGGGPGALCCSHPNFHPLIKRIAELGGLIVMHTWFKTGGKRAATESTPTDLAELAASYPEQTFLCAHAGGEWEQGIAAVRDSANILVETSGFDPTAGFIERAVRELGAQRIVFGSHLPSRSLGTELAKITGANLPDEAKQQILGENYRRLLKM